MLQHSTPPPGLSQDVATFSCCRCPFRCCPFGLAAAVSLPSRRPPSDRGTGRPSARGARGEEATARRPFPSFPAGAAARCVSPLSSPPAPRGDARIPGPRPFPTAAVLSPNEAFLVMWVTAVEKVSPLPAGNAAFDLFLIS